MADLLPACRLRLLPDCSILQIAGWPATGARFAEEVARVCGVVPASEGVAGRGFGDLLLLQVAPYRLWAVEASGTVADRLRVELDPLVACTTPIGFGQRRFRLEGARVPEVLSMLSALDLESPRMAVGRAAWAAVHRVRVLLYRPAPAAFELFLPRSFAQSVWELVAGAARACDGEVSSSDEQVIETSTGGARERTRPNG